MKHYKKTIISGDVVEVYEYFSRREIKKGLPRGSNQNLSSEQQQKINLRMARQKLSRLINANFRQGDLSLVLTYSEAIKEETARAQLSKYLRKLRATRRKAGLPDLKYVAVTEAGDKKGRIHHHILLNTMPMDMAVDLWSNGRVFATKLDPGGDFIGLAMYITKNVDTNHKKRWSQSRNLTKPIETVKMLTGSRSRRLAPPKGYKMTELQTYATENGVFQYLRALRVGGADYAIGAGNGIEADIE